MIESEEDIERNNTFVTPAISQIVFKDGSTIQLEVTKLTISAPAESRVSQLATKYCSNLPYIRATGIGINFTYEVDDDFDKWINSFKKFNFKDASISGMDFVFSVNADVKANVKIFNVSNSKASVQFNFHSSYADIILGEINIDFKKDEKLYKGLAEDFLKVAFNTNSKN